MAQPTDPTLRQELRQKTRADHDQLDRRVSTLNVAVRQGFSSFAQLHLSCFLAMQSRLCDGCISASTLAEMILGLEQDLQVLSTDHLPHQAIVEGPVDPLALDYMVAGSRLGTKVLQRIWVTSNDPIVQKASAYFGQTVDPTLWPKTCDALANVPINSPRADLILRDVVRLFQLFDRTFDRLARQSAAVV